MLLYQLDNENEKHVIVLGLGVVEPGQSRVFTPDEAAGFERQNGFKLNQDNAPQGVTVTVLVDGGEK